MWTIIHVLTNVLQSFELFFLTACIQLSKVLTVGILVMRRQIELS